MSKEPRAKSMKKKGQKTGESAVDLSMSKKPSNPLPPEEPQAKPRESAVDIPSPTRPGSIEYPPQEFDRFKGSDKYGCCGWVLVAISYFFTILTFPLSWWFCMQMIQEYERAVIFRLGRLLPGGTKGPGLFFILPCVDEFRRIDLRLVSYDVPPQEILSLDSVTVAVDAILYYKITDPVLSVCAVSNATHSTQLLASSSLRNTLGTKSLQDILSKRDDIAREMQLFLDRATDPWGIKVERVEIKDVRLPQSMQRAMAAEAEATREARAKVISAEGEKESSKALKEAADMLTGSNAAIQLRYLQTLNTISAEKNSTIVFPIPMNLINKFA